METAIAEVMTAEDNEAASGEAAAQDPARGRDPRLLSLFSPRTRQMTGDRELDRSFYQAIEELHRDHGDPALPPGFSAAFAQAARNADAAVGGARPEAQNIVRALQDLVNALQGPNDDGGNALRAEGDAGGAADGSREAAAAPARVGQQDAEVDPVFQLLRMAGAEATGEGRPISVMLGRAGPSSAAARASAPPPAAAPADEGRAAPAVAGDTEMTDVADEPPAAAPEAREQAEAAEAAPDGHAPMDGVREQAPAADAGGAAAGGAATGDGTTADAPTAEEAAPEAPDAPGEVVPVQPLPADAVAAPAASTPAAGASAHTADAAVQPDSRVQGGAAAAPAQASEGGAGATGDAAAPAADAEEAGGNGVLTARMRERATAAGLDVSMLEALPPDMVRETLLAYGVDIRDTGGGASEAAAAAEDTRAALEGVIPPELLNEGLQAERDRAARRLREFSGARQQAAAGDAPAAERGAADGPGAAVEANATQDFATMIMSFPTDVREDALASLPADVVEQLPASLRSQAQRLQGRRAVPGRMRESMGHHLGRIGGGAGGAAGHRSNRDVTRGEAAALSSLLSGTLDRMPAPLTQLPDTAPCEELGVDSVKTLIKLNACASALESESSVLSSSSRPDIHDGVTAILIGCLPTQGSVARVCSLLMDSVNSFLVQPRAVAPPSSALVRRLVLGLDTTRAAMCPQANDAALVLTGLLGMMGDLSKFDGHVAQYASHS